MHAQDLNPRSREWPESDPEYGKVLEEQFFECKSGPKRVAVVEKNGDDFLIFQDGYVEQGEVGFGGATWFKVDDGTARLALRLGRRVLQNHLSGG
jgi:hypothetical protein